MEETPAISNTGEINEEQQGGRDRFVLDDNDEAYHIINQEISREIRDDQWNELSREAEILNDEDDTHVLFPTEAVYVRNHMVKNGKKS